MIQIDNKSIADAVAGGTDNISKQWVSGYSDCSVNAIDTNIVYEVIGAKPKNEALITGRDLCKKIGLTQSELKRTNAPYYTVGGKKRYSFSQTLDYLLKMKPCLVVNENSFRYKASSDIVVTIVNSKSIDVGLQPFERVVLNEYFKWGYTLGDIARNYGTDTTYIKNVYQYAIKKIKNKLI